MNEGIIHFDAIVSALGGCGATALVAKYFITKALADLSKLQEKIEVIDKSLAMISVRLEKLSEHEATILDHTKQIAFLEAVAGKFMKAT